MIFCPKKLQEMSSHMVKKSHKTCCLGSVFCPSLLQKNKWKKHTSVGENSTHVGESVTPFPLPLPPLFPAFKETLSFPLHPFPILRSEPPKDAPPLPSPPKDQPLSTKRRLEAQKTFPLLRPVASSFFTGPAFMPPPWGERGREEKRSRG